MEEKNKQEYENEKEKNLLLHEEIILLQAKCTSLEKKNEDYGREIKELRKCKTLFKTKYQVACNSKQNLKESVKNKIMKAQQKTQEKEGKVAQRVKRKLEYSVSKNSELARQKGNNILIYQLSL